MSSSRFASFKEIKGWGERIDVEQRASRLNLLRQELQDIDDGQGGVKAPQARSKLKPTQPAQILPHLVTESQRKKIAEAVLSPLPVGTGQPNTQASLPSPAPPPSEGGRSSSVSRRSKSVSSAASDISKAPSSRLTRTSIDTRLEKLESTLEMERQGRMAVQEQLADLKTLLEKHLTKGRGIQVD